jgi:hypothetical protein
MPFEAAPFVIGPPLDTYVSHDFLSFSFGELPSENLPAMAKWRVSQAVAKIRMNRSLTCAAQ